MGYLKAFVVSAAVALAVIFMIQNIEPLSHPLALRLNLYFVNLESTPYPTYLIILLSFFFGLLAASLVGILERLRLRKQLKGKGKEIDRLNNEINSLRNMPVNEINALQTQAAPLAVKQAEPEVTPEQASEDAPENGNK